MQWPPMCAGHVNRKRDSYSKLDVVRNSFLKEVTVELNFSRWRRFRLREQKRIFQKLDTVNANKVAWYTEKQTNLKLQKHKIQSTAWLNMWLENNQKVNHGYPWCYIKFPVSDWKSSKASKQRSCIGKLHVRKTPSGFVNYKFEWGKYKAEPAKTEK